MRRTVLLLAFAAVGATSETIPTPIGSVASSEPVLLRGVPLPFYEVSSWPVIAGDEIATGGSPAIFLFRDRSRVVMDARSKARLEKAGGGTAFRLLEGRLLSSDLAPGSMLRIQAPEGGAGPARGFQPSVRAEHGGGGPPFNPPGPPPGRPPRSPHVPCGPPFNPPGPPPVIPPQNPCHP